MPTDWDIQKGKTQCGKCQSRFLDDQPYHSLLRLDADPLVRDDYCQRCWAQEVAATLAGLVRYAAWSGRMKIVLPIPKEEPIPKDHAQALFRRLLSSQDPNTKRVLFVLAVMLERKKILKRQTVIGGNGGGDNKKQMLLYTHAQTTESIVIEDPQIPLAGWNEVQQEVKRLLAGC